jgi:hypothetical protein
MTVLDEEGYDPDALPRDRCDAPEDEPECPVCGEPMTLVRDKWVCVDCSTGEETDG